MSKEKGKEEEKDEAKNPVGEGESSPEEKEQQELEERLQYAFETIAKEMPGAEPEYVEYDRNSIYIWIPYVTAAGADRGALVGVLFLVREDAETHEYYLKSQQEILDSIKTLKSDFVFERSQICAVTEKWKEANKQ